MPPVRYPADPPPEAAVQYLQFFGDWAFKERTIVRWKDMPRNEQTSDMMNLWLEILLLKLQSKRFGRCDGSEVLRGMQDMQRHLPDLEDNELFKEALVGITEAVNVKDKRASPIFSTTAAWP